MTVNVTQDDINNSMPHDSGNCPVARAISRVVNCRTLAVEPDQVIFTRMRHRLTKIVKLPPEVVRFIEQFDNDDTRRGLIQRGELKPFSFEFYD